MYFIPIKTHAMFTEEVGYQSHKSLQNTHSSLRQWSILSFSCDVIIRKVHRAHGCIMAACLRNVKQILDFWRVLCLFKFIAFHRMTSQLVWLISVVWSRGGPPPIPQYLFSLISWLVFQNGRRRSYIYEGLLHFSAFRLFLRWDKPFFLSFLFLVHAGSHWGG